MQQQVVSINIKFLFWIKFCILYSSVYSILYTQFSSILSSKYNLLFLEGGVE